MDFFPDSLARLKHALRVSKDQEVAQALELSKTAFSERKKRGAFPEKELRALAARRPELGIDVNYVLTGIDGSAQALLDAKQARLTRAIDAGLHFEEVRAMEMANDPASIQAITALLLRCRATERVAVFNLLSSIVQMREALAVVQPKAAQGDRK